jgi:hypothetical protein
MTQDRTLLTIEVLEELASVHQSPCLSLYQSTHRNHPENQQDPIRFRNLVKVLELSLRQKYPTVEVQPLLKSFESLANDDDFWNHTLDGLAVLGGPNLFRVFALDRQLTELTVVDDKFYTKPLRRILQTTRRYQILALSIQNVRLFEGSRDVLEEISLAQDVPRNLSDALGKDLTEPHETVASYGGVGHGTSPMHHGDGGRQDQKKSDYERFFRAVDKAVLEFHSRPSGLPLILAALPEHRHLFHQVSRNPFLLAEGIAINPDVLQIEELRDRAWKVVEPQYQAQLASLVYEFATAKSHGLGSDDMEQVAKAASIGRIATLLIESGRQIGGVFDSTTGQVKLADIINQQADDLLDCLGEFVRKMGGNVMAVPSEQMPGKTGIAAIYRY